MILDATNQTYQEQIWIANPFLFSLTATVTQVLPDSAAVLSTDGATNLQAASIVWTSVIAASNVVEDTLTFDLSVIPGTLTNLPPPTVMFSDTNGNSLSLQGVSPNFDGLFPVQVTGSIPLGVAGVDSLLQMTVTNLTSASQAGSLMVTLADSSGNAVTNLSEAFSLDGSDGTNLIFTLPGFLSAGSYTLTCSLSISGGTEQVLAGTYVVPAPPVALGLGSQSPMTTNGFNLLLQGPAGNYTIEASLDISSPTNWQPIIFYPTTNSPFYLNFTDSNATNYPYRFYRAIMR